MDEIGFFEQDCMRVEIEGGSARISEQDCMRGEEDDCI